jgi:hypothetical protein
MLRALRLVSVERVTIRATFALSPRRCRRPARCALAEGSACRPCRAGAAGVLSAFRLVASDRRDRVRSYLCPLQGGELPAQGGADLATRAIVRADGALQEEPVRPSTAPTIRYGYAEPERTSGSWP